MEMARKLTKMLKDAYRGTRERNYEGFPSFSRSVEEQTLQVLTTGVCENSFYADAKTLTAEALGMIGQMAARDPELLAKMIVYARNEGLLRAVPIHALTVLSKVDSRLFAAIFPRVIRTPNDLKDFVTLVRKGDLRTGLGRSVKRAINAWLNGLTEYHAIKYGSRGGDITLRDVLRLTHPRPKDPRSDVLFQYLIHGLTPRTTLACGRRCRRSEPWSGSRARRTRWSGAG